MPLRHKLIATVTRGTEDLCAAELKALGYQGIRQRAGAIEFRGSLGDALRACLELRTAMRVLLPLARFAAPGPDGLYEGLRTIPWADRITLAQTFAIEVSGESEGLTHSLFVAQKSKDAIVDTLREKLGGRPNVNLRDPDVRVVVHLSEGQADVSLDVAGDSLHRRGWRVQPHPASLKETLAAAILLAAGYDGERPLRDPMCGAGTLAIEAALIAEGRAPNLRRRFGAERWPGFSAADREALRDLRAEAEARVRPARAPILASDRDPEAILAAKANAARAGVKIEFSEVDAREVAPLDPPGLLVANPPYGSRVGGTGGGKQLKTFFHALGERYRTFDGHTLAFLSGASAFESAFGMRPSSRRRLFNGPIPCELLVYRVGRNAQASRPPPVGRQSRPPPRLGRTPR